VFADIPERALSALRRLGWTIPGIFGETGCRLMCAWSTTPEDVRGFVDCLRSVLQSDGRPAT
jgi:threonine aldolase